MGTDFVSNTRRIGRDDREPGSPDFAAIADRFRRTFAAVEELAPHVRPLAN